MHIGRKVADLEYQLKLALAQRPTQQAPVAPPQLPPALSQQQQHQAMTSGDADDVGDTTLTKIYYKVEKKM